MFVVLISNIICAICLIFFDINYLYSFEVAFFGSMAVIYSSYKAVSKKIQASVLASELESKNNIEDSESKNIIDSKEDSKEDDNFNVSKKDRFFIGFRISFGLFRILSYFLITIGIISLINNKLFFIVPFLLGVCVCSFAMAFSLNRATK